MWCQLLLQKYLLNGVGAAMLVSEVPGDLTSTCRLLSCLVSVNNKKTILNHCVFRKCYETMLQGLEALSEEILVPCPSEGKRKILLSIPCSKGIILLALEIFTSFCNHKTIRANLQYVDGACHCPAQFLLYHLWENFRAMRGGTAATGSCCVWEWMGGERQLFIL